MRPLVPTVTESACKTKGKRYNTIGAKTPKVQYSSAGWVRKDIGRLNREKNLPDLVLVIC
jgi:hypothetical protein